MGKGLNAAGVLVEFQITDEQRRSGEARGAERRRQRAWNDCKASARTALARTDYLAASDRRLMTDAEKKYRETLRAIIRAEPNGNAPDLPTLP